MGLLQKFKNIFVEEVEEEVIPEKKEFTSIKRSEQPEITKPIPAAPVLKEEEKNVQPVKKDEKFVFPVYFDDKDFEEIKRETEKKNVVQPKKEMQPIKKNEDNGGHRESYKEAYNNKKNIETREKKVFKPTPIISPVYGILDKNYYKEDIVVTTTTRTSYKESNRPITIDDVRNKAFGTLEDDLENTILSNENFDNTPKHGKLEDDNEIFNELDFANAIEEDKKRDLTKDGLKSDIESLLKDDEFKSAFDFKKNETENDTKSSSLADEIENVSINDNQYSDDEETVGTIGLNEEMKDDDIELPINVSSAEIENAYNDSSDLNDSDLFNLIDSMYDKEEK